MSISAAGRRHKGNAAERAQSEAMLARAVARIESDPTASLVTAFNPPKGEPYDLDVLVLVMARVAKLLGGLPVDVPVGSSPAVIAVLRALLT